MNVALASGDSAALDDAIRSMDSAGAWDYEDRLRAAARTVEDYGHDAEGIIVVRWAEEEGCLGSCYTGESGLLILDEPTNHLDIEIIEWLEGYLKRSKVALLMVTHDRYFLDRVCNKIIEIDRQQIYTYDGNFDYYLRRRRNV